MAKTKKDALRQINVKPEVTAGGSLIEQTQVVASPAIDVGRIPAPTGLTLLSTTIARSTQSPMAYINVSWNPPVSITPEYYEVEYGKQSDWNGTDFNNPQRIRANTNDAALLADANTAYFVRVRAVYRSTVSIWTDTLSVTTAIDTTPPPNFTSTSANFVNGDLVVTWSYTTIPNNFKHAAITVWNAGRTVLYGTFTDATGRFVWREADNLAASSGVGVTSVSVDIVPVSWAATSGTTTTIAASSTAPNAVTTLAFDFDTGDLNISWVNPTNAPFKYVEVSIYRDNTAVTLYRVITTSANRTTWTVDNNFADSARVGGSPSPDPSVYVVVRVVGWLNQVSTNVTGTATKAVPSTPGGLTSTWASDAGLAGADIVLSWNGVSNIKDYEVSVNSTVIGFITDTRYLYTYNQNVTQNGGVGDPTLSISIRARDRLHQFSTAATLNAVNAAPNVSNVTINTQPGFSTIGAYIAFTSKVLDFKDIIWTAKIGTTTIATITTEDTIVVFPNLASGTYTIEAQVRDLFNQSSAAAISAPMILDALTIEDLRQETIYTDSIGSTDAQLAPLKDDNRASGGRTYTSPSTAGQWARWTRFERPLIDRYRTITLAFANGTGTARWYIRTSTDLTTWRYFAGPMSISPTSVATMAEVANEADARSGFIDSSFYGNSTLYSRINLPSIVEARYVEVWHSSSGSSQTYTLNEFYPRRLVQSDDIEAESIRAINIAAGAITADKITVTTLAAIQTSTGTLVINSGGHIRSGMTAYDTGVGYYFDNNGGTPRFSIGNSGGTKLLWDGTNLTLQGSGLIIRTAANNQRVQLTSAGLYGYNSSNVEQFRIQSSDGKAIAGAGAVQLDADGFSIFTGTLSSIESYRSLKIIRGSKTIFNVYGYEDFSSWSATLINAYPVGNTSTNHSIISIAAARGDNVIGAQLDIVSGGRDDGVPYILVKATQLRLGTTLFGRVAFTDAADGWLRVNNDSDYTNGVYIVGNQTVTNRVNFGSTLLNYLPAQDGSDWSTKGTITLNADTHSSILFHDTGNRVDAIIGGGGSIRFGYNIGFGNPTGEFAFSANIFGEGAVATASQRVRIISTGDNTGHYPLVVTNLANNSSLFHIQSQNSSTAVGFLAATAWTYSSDERLKEDIKDLATQKAKFKQLKPKSFKYIGTAKESIGFTAQDMQAIYPELVEEVSDGINEPTLGIKTTDLIPILVKEVQELEEEVENLKTELAKLKDKK